MNLPNRSPAITSIDLSLAAPPAIPAINSEAATHADFSHVRYAQCWEDADVLLEALDIKPGDDCLSIGSAGDNALAMLTRDPGRVVVIDLNPSQLACLELRVAAYRELDHAGLLELIGSRPSERRGALYRRCRSQLTAAVRAFWDAQPDEVAAGIGGAGKFERYFATFRDRVLPWVHSREKRERLLRGGSRKEREAFYDDEWDTWRWQLMFRVFFSRFVMGRMGRDPSFFRYVEGSVAERILTRARHALTVLNPAENPYLEWILTGRHGAALPLALRPENFEAIRRNLDRIEWHCRSLESYLDTVKEGTFDRFNLSDIFEYISEENYHRLLERVIRAGGNGARLAYWNTLVERHRPDSLAEGLRSLDTLSRSLHLRDKAFFYNAFIVEEIFSPRNPSRPIPVK
jgi:S-adenosylmethionine-diacylglycerol 3-amino-3-carboxypropyl transferase